MALPLSSMRFKASSGTTTVIHRRVAYHQVKDLFILSFDIIKRNIYNLLVVQLMASETANSFKFFFIIIGTYVISII